MNKQIRDITEELYLFTQAALFVDTAAALVDSSPLVLIEDIRKLKLGEEWRKKRRVLKLF